MHLTLHRGSCAEDTDLGIVVFGEYRMLLKESMYSEKNTDGVSGLGSKVNLAGKVTVGTAGDVLRHL